MSANSRLTIGLHILSWMSLTGRTSTNPVTSDRIALSVNTNPVVIRRLLSRLQKAGLVHSHRGANAGWTLAKTADAISVKDVLDALGEDGPFALHKASPNPACPVGRGIQPTLSRLYDSLDVLIGERLAQTTIEQLLNETLRPSPPAPVSPG